MWVLRQPIEGDKFITVNNVSDNLGDCWIDVYGNYIPNSIAINIDTVEYPLYSVYNLQLGFLTIKVPNSVYIKANTKVRVYSKCSNNPEYQTLEQLAKPIDFRMAQFAPFTECNTSVEFTPVYSQWIRVYMGEGAGNYFKGSLFDITIGSPYVDLSTFFIRQPGNVGGYGIFVNSPIETTFIRGDYTPPNNEPVILFSKISIPIGGATFSINAYPDKYFTIRVGFLEAIFNKGKLYYINYMSDSFEETYVMDYNFNQTIDLRYGSGCGIYYQGIPVVEIAPRASFNVSAGSVYPTMIRPVVETTTWTVPPIKGTYTIETNLGQGSKFISTVELYSCAEVVDDYFVGIPDQPFSGNVSLNDKLCDGATNIVYDTGLPWNGIIDLNIDPDGTFVLVPPTGYTGLSTFVYQRNCGDTIVGYGNVTVDYSQGCANLDPVWEDTGKELCIDCVPKKEQRNTNITCSGGDEFRWVITGNNSICNFEEDWEDTNETFCDYAHKYMKQVNLNNCSSGENERFIDLGISPDCECISEVYINTCCGDPDYYPVVKLLGSPNEENRALQLCLKPDLGETCLKNKRLSFYTLNDGLAHTYVINLFDCNYKLINQVILKDLICVEGTGNQSGFDYTFDFNFTQ